MEMLGGVAEVAAQELAERAEAEADQLPGLEIGENEAAEVGNMKIYAAQCFVCLRWRIIPCKATYEAIREKAPEKPWVCGDAREWRPEISCLEAPDLEQGSSRGAIWTLDKPGIPSPPAGWKRDFLLLGTGSRFGRVVYFSPCGKRFRSRQAIEKFLLGHPEHLEAGTTIEKFSFVMPQPLEHQRKRLKLQQQSSSKMKSLSELYENHSGDQSPVNSTESTQEEEEASGTPPPGSYHVSTSDARVAASGAFPHTCGATSGLAKFKAGGVVSLSELE